MGATVEWVGNPAPVRKARGYVAGALAAIVALNVLLFLWNQDVWSSMVAYNAFMSGLTVVAVVFLASGTPTRIAVDASNLRVHYLVGERRVPLAEVVATDLAPGARHGLSTLRVARHRARKLTVTLETLATEAVADRLELRGLWVNRRPPPQALPPG